MPPPLFGADDNQFEGRAYRLDRGDTDLVVLPPQFITELNGLPQNMISSRKSHASTLLGHLNGMDVVLKTNHHVKMLLNRITPALPELLKPSQVRIDQTLTRLFPQRSDVWTAVNPVDKIVLCISRSITLVTFGDPICDDPELVRTFMEHTRNGECTSNLYLRDFSKDDDSFFSSLHNATGTVVLAASPCLASSRQVALAANMANLGAFRLSRSRATSFRQEL